MLDRDWYIRIRSGILYVIFMLGVTFHPISLSLAASILAAGCVYEWMKISGRSNRILFSLMAGICTLIYLPFSNIHYIVLIGLLGFAGIYIYSIRDRKDAYLKSIGFIYGTVPLIAWTAIPNHEAILNGHVSPYMLIFIMAVTWTHDSLAYATGRLLGKHKLAPKISPGKTWEGSVGGLLGGVLAACLCLGNWEWQSISWGIIVSLGALAGDLFESAFKRKFGVKDSGNILPGHGGFLDRLDAMLFTAPLTWFWLFWQS